VVKLKEKSASMDIHKKRILSEDGKSRDYFVHEAHDDASTPHFF
jgi:hypothetical protein